MLKNLMKIVVAIIALSMILSVIISHSDNDIRDTILSSFQDKPKKELFKVYHFLFQKKYDLNTEEGLNKYRTFKANMKMIEAENAKNLGYTLGLTEFTDMTNEEFKKARLSIVNPAEIEASMQKFLASESITNEQKFEVQYQDEDDMLISNSKSPVSQTTPVNWGPKMNPVTNQGGCGSCWAFATIGAIEGNYNVNFGNSPSFSHQQLVDCDKGSNGCSGGNPDGALRYLTKSGLAYANSYPYVSGTTGKADTCKAASLKLNGVVLGFDTCSYGRCTRDKQRALLARGPLIVYVDADGSTGATKIFQHYKSGILAITCSQINHAIVLTGFDKDEKGEFLYGMNSWGAGWGEKGYFRIRVNDADKTCFMEAYGSLPKVQKSDQPVPPPPVPGCLKLYSQCGLQGDSKEICTNTPKFANFPFVAGYDTGKFKKLKFFLGENCQNGYYSFENQSFSCLADVGVTASFKSVIVDEQIPPQGCVWLYDDSCISGNKVEVCTDVPDLNDPKYNFGNKTTSIKFGPGVKGVSAYLDPNYEGSYTTLRQDRYSFEGSWLNKDIESVKIIKA